MGLFDNIPDRSNGQDIEAGWFNIIKQTLNNVFDMFGLNDLVDVTITNPQDQQILKYDQGSGKWTNQQDTGGGSGGGGYPLLGDGNAEWNANAGSGSGFPNEQLDNSQTTGLGAAQRKAFTFTLPDASVVGPNPIIDAIRINYIIQTTGTNKDGVLNVRLFDTVGGVPNNELANFGSIFTNPPAGQWDQILTYNASFADVPALPNTTYAVVLSTTDTGVVLISKGAADEPDSQQFQDFNNNVWTLSSDQQTMYHRIAVKNIPTNNELILDQPCFVNVPGVAFDRHEIAAQTISIENDQVAHIPIDPIKPGSPTVRPVTVENVVDFIDDGTKLVILSSKDNIGYFGITDPVKLDDGDIVPIQKSAATTQFLGLVQQGTPASPETIGTGGQVGFANVDRQCRYVESDGGQVIIAAGFQITPGNGAGKEMVLIGTNDMDYIRLEDGRGLALNGFCDLKNNVAIHLMWNGSVWNEISRR